MHVATSSWRLVAEAAGSALLVTAVVGSRIMALATAHAVALVANTIATGGAPIAILLIFAPISGASTRRSRGTAP